MDESSGTINTITLNTWNLEALELLVFTSEPAT
jgi:hypothetical protein